MDVTYNDVAFTIVKTNELSFTPVWSEDRTSYLYTRVRVDVEGILNPQAMAYVAGDPPTPTPDTLPPVTVAAVRHALLQPRKTLLVTSATGDSLSPTATVIRSPASGSSVDLDNGPRPVHCVIKNFSGARTWVISWICETTIHECPNEAEEEAQDPLLSNRYSSQDEIDEQWKSSRVTSGVAVFRTDILEDTSRVADDFRAFVLPPVPLGFQRRRISVTAVPSRNALHWSVTDQERMYDLGDTSSTGSFITDVQGTYGVSTVVTPEGIASGQSLGQLFIRVVGDKRASNWTLTQRAFALAAGKIPIGAPPPGAGAAIPGWIRQLSVNQSLVDREVTISVVYMHNPPAQGAVGISNLAVASLRVDSVFPNAGGVNPSPPWGAGTQGTSGLKLLVAALEQACSGAATFDCPSQGEIPGPGDQCGPPPVVAISTADELPTYPTNIATPETQNPYNMYNMRTRYSRSSSILMAPIASPPANSGSGSSGSSFSGSSGSGSSGSVLDSNNGGSDQNPSAAFFRLASPTTTVTVTFECERVNAPPSIPDPNTANSNLVLLHHHITPVASQILPDGVTVVAAVSGEYVFGAVNSMGLNEPIGMGVLPWVAASFVDLQITADNYRQGLIDGGSQNFA